MNFISPHGRFCFNFFHNTNYKCVCILHAFSCFLITETIVFVLMLTLYNIHLMNKMFPFFNEKYIKMLQLKLQLIHNSCERKKLISPKLFSFILYCHQYIECWECCCCSSSSVTFLPNPRVRFVCLWDLDLLTFLFVYFFSASSVILRCFFSASSVLLQCFFSASSVLLQFFFSVLRCFFSASSVLL